MAKSQRLNGVSQGSSAVARSDGSIPSTAKSGSGRLPEGFDVVVADIPDCAAAVIMLADAKAIRAGVGKSLFVRSIKPGVSIGAAQSVLSCSL